MKTTLTPSKEVPPKYPYAGIFSFDESFLVLFTSRNAGVVLMDQDNIHGLGHFSSAWQEDLFTAWNGKIEVEV